MPKLSWQVAYDYREPPTEMETELARIRELRWLLDVDENDFYTREELEEMYDPRIEEEER